MRRGMGQIAGGIASALAAVALAVLVTHLVGIRLASGSAKGSEQPAAAQQGPAVSAQPGDPGQGFSVLHNARADGAPPAVIQEWQSMHAGSYADAKTVAAGMYLATNGDSLCARVEKGFSACTGSDLNAGDAWLQGDMVRTSDSESAPFEVNLYGFARDGVSAIRVSPASGKPIDLVVANNGFRGTLDATSFSDITGLALVYASGKTVSLDPSNYFPHH